MPNQLVRFSALEPAERALFVRASFMLLLVSLSIRWRGFRKTQSWLQRSKFSPRTLSSVPEEDIVGKTARMACAAARRSFLRPSCLEDSLVLWWLLRRQGIEAQLRIGVRKEAQTFEAHAWVECGGLALNQPDSKHEHYAAFDEAFSSSASEKR